MKMIMNEILSDKMLHEIFEALKKGESYSFSDENTTVKVTPNSISINYNSTPVKTNTKDKEVTEFLNFCDSINNDLFVEVCKTFADDELYKLQTELDTDRYRNTIKVFSTRIKEVAHNKLAEICNAADSEIRRQEMIIEEAKKAIENIHKELDEAHTKYSI